MPIKRVCKAFGHEYYFITMTVRNWHYLFDRPGRWQILADCIKFYQREHSLQIHSYVFMLNHIHLVVSMPNVIYFIKGFKSFTTRKLKEDIYLENKTILEQFYNKNGRFSVWIESNMPKILESNRFAEQKMEYIHMNPVRKEYVNRPENWHWSSANPDSPIEIVALY